MLWSFFFNISAIFQSISKSIHSSSQLPILTTYFLLSLGLLSFILLKSTQVPVDHFIAVTYNHCREYPPFAVQLHSYYLDATSYPTLCDPMDCRTPGLPPSPTPRVCSNSCLSSWWCHPTFPSSEVPFSSCLQSFPASGSFPMSRLFASGDQSIAASASVLPMNIQDWFPLVFTG